MRRAQAILVILTLASLPLILLAQNGSGPACDGMCCVRHPMRASSSHADGMSCHHDAAGHLFECGMSSQRTQNATLAPLPPTMLPAAMILPEPLAIRDTRASNVEQTFPGFLAQPFEPPRS